MTSLSGEQEAVIAADLGPLAVLACAGSGKTRTAVHRLVEVRRRLALARGRVALLSFSNIAVDTFRRDFAALCEARSIPPRGGVEIDTIDGFITANILRPHAYRVMKAPRAAFLVSGSEPFLKGFTLPPPSRGAPPISVGQIHTKVVDRRFEFFLDIRGTQVALDKAKALGLIERLGKVGAYTHDLGRFWTCKALMAEADLLKAFAHRYPEILVDEAQDIGSAQQAILGLLAKAGASVTLIGDPHQGIYEYAGADGAYLRGHSTSPYPLSRNYRSVPAINEIAQRLAAETGETHRPALGPPAGAYAVAYTANDHDALIAAFRQAIEACGLDVGRSAVLCRATSLVETITGGGAALGAGAVRMLARAAALRDGRGEYHRAFRLVAEALDQSLLDTPPEGFAHNLLDPNRHPELRPVRRLIWNFVRSRTDGLPGAHLQADTDWLDALRVSTQALLSAIEAATGLAAASNLAMRLSAKALPSTPVSTVKADPAKPLRVDTVHGAKGETLDAVLYITTKAHLEGMLAGTGSEIGRIGYVAATRPRDLLWIGVPAADLNAMKPRLECLGFTVL
jgi:superfamily I DNA/RNA helicase